MINKEIEEDKQYLKDVISLAVVIPDIKIQEEEIETITHLLQYIEKLEKEIKKLKFYRETDKMIHDNDIQIIDKVKGERVEQYKKIRELENKVKELSKGQHTLMQSRRKWKNRYYKEKRKLEV